MLFPLSPRTSRRWLPPISHPLHSGGIPVRYRSPPRRRLGARCQPPRSAVCRWLGVTQPRGLGCAPGWARLSAPAPPAPGARPRHPPPARRRRLVYTENTAPSSKIFAAPTIGKKNLAEWPGLGFFFFFSLLLLFLFFFFSSQITIRCLPCSERNFFPAAFNTEARPSLGYLAGRAGPGPAAR